MAMAGIVKSSNTKGNQLHDAETGEFTGEDSFGTFELKKEQEKPRLNLSSDAAKMFLAKKKEKDVAQANEFLSKNVSDKIGFYNSLDENELNNLISESDQGYKKNLSIEEKKALLCAEDIVNKKNEISNEINILEKEKEDLTKKMNDEIINHEANQQSFEGIWYGAAVHPSDYEAKSAVADYPGSSGKSSIDLKKEYYNDILTNPLEESLANKAKATQMMKKLSQFEETGKAFKEISNGIKAKYVDNFEEIESKIIELNSEKAKYDVNSPLYLEASSFIESHQDKNAAYSQFRKNNATWIDDKWIKSHPEYQGIGTIGAAKKYFGDKFESMWQKMTSAEKTQVKDYTGNGYSKYNKPLRGLKHFGWGGFNFANAVTNLTNALNKCTWDEDIWVQRGVHPEDMKFILPGGMSAKSLKDINDNDLQSLIGTSFRDGGFYSAGAGKNTGMEERNLIINTYCPKGTKMAYVENYTMVHGENEMILQRGYSYRITKIEHKGYRYFMDVEVVLGSDKNNVTDLNELSAIGKKYLG